MGVPSGPPREPISPIRLGVCVSGGGTTLQNLLDRIAAGTLDARVVQVVAAPADLPVLQADRELLATICLVSEVTVREGGPVAEGAERFQVSASKSTYAKCERCWNYREEVGKDAKHPTLCGRCVRVIESLNAKGPA